MSFSALAGLPQRRRLAGPRRFPVILNHLLRHLAPGSAVDGSFKSAALATALGVLVLMSWPIMPARGGDLYYPDQYGPYRYSETYDRPYRPRVRCYACGCSLSC